MQMMDKRLLTLVQKISIDKTQTTIILKDWKERIVLDSCLKKF
jgi:hypothetical protein